MYAFTLWPLTSLRYIYICKDVVRSSFLGVAFVWYTLGIITERRRKIYLVVQKILPYIDSIIIICLVIEKDWEKCHTAMPYKSTRFSLRTCTYMRLKCMITTCFAYLTWCLGRYIVEILWKMSLVFNLKWDMHNKYILSKKVPFVVKILLFFG